jgi:hypothetical protein
MQNDDFLFKVVSGVIIENNVWSETHVSGGGGGSTPFGGVHVSSVKSRVVERQKIWLQGDDGQQFEMNYRNNDLPCRYGHRLSFYYMRAKRAADKPKNWHLVLTYNHETQSHYRDDLKIADAVNQAVPFSFILLFLWVAGIVGTNIGSRETHFFLAAFVLGIPYVFISYLRHRPSRKRAYRDLDSEVERLRGGGSVDVLPAGHASVLVAG